MASSVQFKGIDGVVNAYENRNVAAWSLWQGKQFMFKYEGGSIEEGGTQLQSTLELLAESTNAVYTLKVYEDLPGGKIKSNTADDGSFNFKINGDEQALTQNQYTSIKNNNAIADRLAAIEQRLIEQDEEGEEEPENKLGMIGDIISHPVIAPMVQNIFAAMLSGMKTNTAAPPQMQRVAINGINDDAQILEAVNDLKALDPNLSAHLAKLAKLGKESPDSFKFLLATLDNMQL